MADNPLPLIEGALFIAGEEGLEITDLKKIFDVPVATLREHVEKLANRYRYDQDSGLALVRFGDRYKIVTKPEHKDAYAKLLDFKLKNPLSGSHMEVLAIIAYNQPCTRRRIEEIRGSLSLSALESLVAKGLVSDEKRDEAVGHPILYEVTPKFYDLLGIRSLSELPKLSVTEAQQIRSNLFDVERYIDNEQ